MLYFETIEERLMMSSGPSLAPNAINLAVAAATPKLPAITTPFRSTRDLSLTGFTLVNTLTNQQIGPLVEGETIDLASLPKAGLSIVANSNARTVPSVVFGYDGNTQFHTENYVPYTLIGSGEGNYTSWQPTLGSHTVTAVAHASGWGVGRTGTGIKVDFNVINSAAVTTFKLMNADNRQVIGTLTDGQTINLAALPTSNLSIVADTNPGTVGSVVFGYDTNAGYHTENFASYSLSGKTWNSFYAWTPTVGSHTVTATPYSFTNGGGAAGTALTAHFTVVNNPVVAPPSPAANVTGFSLVDLDNGQTIESLSEGETIDLSTLPTQNVTIIAATDSSAGSLVFGYDTNASYQTTDASPYELTSWTATTGTHTITATAYSGADATGSAGTPLSVDFTFTDIVAVPPPMPAQAATVTGFNLIDADNGQIIQSLGEGGTIDLAALPTQNVMIEADTDSPAASVVFGYDTNATYQVTDSSPAQVSSWAAAVGDHTITATAYSDLDGSGVAGSPLSVNFTIVNNIVPVITPAAAVTGFNLVNADNGQTIESLSEGDTIDLASMPTQNLTVLATTDSTPGSVVFGYDSNTAYQVVDSSPYELNSWTAALGAHTITATAYSGADGNGTVGTPLSVDFSIINSTPISTPVVPTVTGFTLIDADSGQPIGPLVEGETIDLANFGNENLNIVATADASSVASVSFGYDNNATYQLSDTAPYSISSLTLAPGSHSLSATPYSAADGGGVAGAVAGVDFSVIDSTPIIAPSQPAVASISGFNVVDDDNGQFLGSLGEGQTIDLGTLPTQNISIVATTSDATAGSVLFGVDSNANAQASDASPYTLTSFALTLGSHTVTAAAYSNADGQGTAGAPASVDFTVVNSTAVTSLFLIDTDNDHVLSQLSEGQTIDLANLPTQDLSIAAATTNTVIGSVLFGYDSNSNYFLQDGSSTLGNGWTPTLGQHTLTATPFSGDDASGLAGTPLSVDFTVVNSSAVANFSVIDADTGQSLGTLSQGGTIDLGKLPTTNLSIVANTSTPAVGSIVFNIDGQGNSDLESDAPFTFSSWIPTLGAHTVSATPYSGDLATGFAGAPLSVKFTVIDTMTVTGFTLINSNNGQSLGALTQGQSIDLGTLPTQNFSILVSTTGNDIGSVNMRYDNGASSAINDFGPYSLNSISLALGTHTFDAVPYSGSDQRGQAGTGMSVQFKVIDSTAVTGFILINAATGQSLGSLADGQTIDLHTLATTNVSVVATTTATTVGSVVFGYDSNSSFTTDNSAPYKLANSWTPAVGTHTITATPYSQANAGGLVGAAGTIHITVIDSTPVVTPPVVTPPVTNNPNITVSITNPINGASQAGPGYFVIRTATADTVGTIGSVAFYVNGTLLGKADAAPFSMAWENAAPGNYSLTAVATDNSGSTTSAAVKVSITPFVVSRTLYVSPSGSNSNNGLSLGAAVQTISQAAALAKPGDTVLVEPGTYRESVVVPTSGTSTLPITFQAAVPGTVIIDGADPIGGWAASTTSANPIFTTAWNHDFFHGGARYYFGLSTDGTTTAIGYAEQFLYNNQPLKQVLTAASMAPGTFTIDYTARTVSVWLPGGATPTSGTMQASTRNHLFVPASTSVQYIRVDGLIFQHASNFAQDEAVQTATGWRVINSTIQGVNAGAIQVKGNDNLLYNDHALNNGDTGIDGTGSNNLFVFDETAGNNYKGFSVFNEAGGGKMAQSDGDYFDQYFAHDNVGPGLWFDYNNSNYVVVNSYFYNNKPRVASYEGVGLSIEISQGPGRVENDTFYGNTGAALDICESMNVTVQNDLFHNSYLELRDLPNRAPYLIQNIHIAENEFDNSFISTSSGTWTAASGTSKQIFIDNDLFHDSGAIMYWGSSTAYTSLSSIASVLGFEKDGTSGAITFLAAPSAV